VKPERHVIGGAHYVPVGVRSADHDVWLMGKIHRANLSEVEVRAGEPREAWARRLLFELCASGEAMLVLGGIIVPEEVGPAGWTEEVAAETARRLGALTGEEDKDAIFGILLTTLLGFSETGIVSFVLLTTSSSEGDGPGAAAATH